MFLCCKNLPVLFWGPLFVGAPVRPNMLNMPKSASTHLTHQNYPFATSNFLIARTIYKASIR